MISALRSYGTMIFVIRKEKPHRSFILKKYSQKIIVSFLSEKPSFLFKKGSSNSRKTRNGRGKTFESIHR